MLPQHTPTYYILLIFCLFAGMNQSLSAQNPDTIPLQERDTLQLSVDSLAAFRPVKDTLTQDSLPMTKKKSTLKEKVSYQAEDSIHFDFKSQKVYMYSNAAIHYGQIDLEADYVEIDFEKKEVFASGVPDSTGKTRGRPVFHEGSSDFESETMTYNFDSKKGIIHNVITKEGEGYLHGETVKKQTDNTTFIKKGSYTTCNLEHPHYEIRFTRSKVIPNNKIVTGPAMLYIEDVALPLIVPFGLFPNSTGQHSGILIPSYGESNNQGFFLEGLGYYFGISDYFDLEVRGDIYSRGSWAIKPNLRYNNRYHYSGRLNFDYAINKIGTPETPSYSEQKNFAIRWNHMQDPKANPYRKFNATVNYVSSNYNRYNQVSTENQLSNTFSSSISYYRNWGSRYTMTASLSHSQNTITKNVNLTLPAVSFSVNKFFPFRKKERSGSLKWYENISVQYKTNTKNTVEVQDTLLFKNNFINQFQNGMKHEIPISSNLKVLKYFNLTNTINYSEKWYLQTNRKQWSEDTLFRANDTIVGYVRSDTVHGFSAAREFRYNATLNTRLYGMMNFRKGPLKALRHVINPSLSFTYRPDFGSEFWNYYREVQIDSLGNTERYSIYENNIGDNFRSIYSGPPDGESGNLSFSVDNNLEIKVRSRRDTVSGFKKIKLIESLRFSTGYDIARKEFKWSPLTVSGRTTLFKKLKINYTGHWDPYAVDSTGVRINELEWDKNHRLLRFTDAAWRLGIDYRFSSKDFEPKEKPESATEGEWNDIVENPQNYINWNNPWSINIGYNLTHNRRFLPKDDKLDKSLIQSLRVNGDISITTKWKINYRMDYDIEDNEFTYASVDIMRDLHCWDMAIHWVPFGFYKSWNFTLKVKASILQDLKLTKKKDFRDNF